MLARRQPANSFRDTLYYGERRADGPLENERVQKGVFIVDRSAAFFSFWGFVRNFLKASLSLLHIFLFRRD